MATYFRKSKNIGGLRLNFGKGGLNSVSFGKKGARISLDKKGNVHRTVGIPGTGIYNREKVRNISDVSTKLNGEEMLEESNDVVSNSDNSANSNFSHRNSNFSYQPKTPSPKKPYNKVLFFIGAAIVVIALLSLIVAFTTPEAFLSGFGSSLLIGSVGLLLISLSGFFGDKKKGCIASLVIFVISFIIIVAAPLPESENDAESELASSEISSEQTSSAELDNSSVAVAVSENSSESVSSVISSAAEQQASEASAPITVTSGLSFKRNQTATVSITGKPNAEYSITVYYSSGASEAAGLENKTSDSNGNVSWSWKIGGKTAPGTYRIVFAGGGERSEQTFTVE